MKSSTALSGGTKRRLVIGGLNCSLVLVLPPRCGSVCALGGVTAAAAPAASGAHPGVLDLHQLVAPDDHLVGPFGCRGRRREERGVRQRADSTTWHTLPTHLKSLFASSKKRHNCVEVDVR